MSQPPPAPPSSTQIVDVGEVLTSVRSLQDSIGASIGSLRDEIRADGTRVQAAVAALGDRMSALNARFDELDGRVLRVAADGDTIRHEVRRLERLVDTQADELRKAKETGQRAKVRVNESQVAVQQALGGAIEHVRRVEGDVAKIAATQEELKEGLARNSSDDKARHEENVSALSAIKTQGAKLQTETKAQTSTLDMLAKLSVRPVWQIVGTIFGAAVASYLAAVSAPKPAPAPAPSVVVVPAPAPVVDAGVPDATRGERP
jgi:chromosome segregation ATPase